MEFAAKLCVKKRGIHCVILSIFVTLLPCLTKHDGFLSGLHFWELLFNNVCQLGINWRPVACHKITEVVELVLVGKKKKSIWCLWIFLVLIYSPSDCPLPAVLVCVGWAGLGCTESWLLSYHAGLQVFNVRFLAVRSLPSREGHPAWVHQG